MSAGHRKHCNVSLLMLRLTRMNVTKSLQATIMPTKPLKLPIRVMEGELSRMRPKRSEVIPFAKTIILLLFSGIGAIFLKKKRGRGALNLT